MKFDKKKLLYSIYSVAFVGMCLAPAILMPFTESENSKENKLPSKAPKIKTEDGKLNFEFFSEFEDYFSEHFAFRESLVTLDGKLRSELFGTSSNEDVIVGREGWLFYEPTAGDFMNCSVLSDRAVNNIIRNLLLLDDYCESQNALFTFTIAPNKNSIYPEFMPYNYIESDNPGNYDKFLTAYSEIKEEWHKAVISSDGNVKIPEFFSFCDLRKTLLQSKEANEAPIYHKTDTHWNNIGALAARNALINLSDVTDGFHDSSWSIRNDWSGDLAEMLYPSDVPMDNQYYTDHEFKYQYSGRVRGLDDINIQTVCESPSVTSGEPFKKLLMYRDSFGEAILPFMAESFSSAEFTRAVPYNTSSITEDMFVVLEIVERNLGNLQKYAPVMPAPIYEESLPEIKFFSDSAYIQAEEKENYWHIYGELGDEFFKDESAKIFVTYNGVTYESFNCFEDKLLGREGETSDNGFSLYIPKGEGQQLPAENEISITVVSGNGETVKYN